MDKFRNKYRISSARAQWWNYGWDAACFVTICTKNRQLHFGEIENERMILSDVGKIAEQCWKEIPGQGENIELGVNVIMPNHVHGILILNGNVDPQASAGNTSSGDACRDKACLVSTLATETEPPNQTVGQSRFQHPGRNTISSILGGYKSAVSKLVARSGLEFGWQSRFHDHIIRDEEEYHRISDYILNNPATWDNNKFFPR